MDKELQAILNDMETDNLFIDDCEDAILATPKIQETYTSLFKALDKINMPQDYKNAETHRLTTLWDILAEITDYTDKWNDRIIIDYGGLHVIAVDSSIAMLQCLIDLFKVGAYKNKCFSLTIGCEHYLSRWIEVAFGYGFEVQRVEVQDGHGVRMIACDYITY